MELYLGISVPMLPLKCPRVSVGMRLPLPATGPKKRHHVDTSIHPLPEFATGENGVMGGELAGRAITAAAASHSSDLAVTQQSPAACDHSRMRFKFQVSSFKVVRETVTSWHRAV